MQVAPPRESNPRRLSQTPDDSPHALECELVEERRSVRDPSVATAAAAALVEDDLPPCSPRCLAPPGRARDPPSHADTPRGSPWSPPRAQGADESSGAAGPGRDGAPRHVGVRAVPGARHQAGDALPVRRPAGRAARAGPEGPCVLKPEDIRHLQNHYRNADWTARDAVEAITTSMASGTAAGILHTRTAGRARNEAAGRRSTDRRDPSGTAPRTGGTERATEIAPKIP